MLRKFYMKSSGIGVKLVPLFDPILIIKYEYWDALSNLIEAEFLKLGYDLKQKNKSNYLGFRWHFGGHLPEKF